eukprot:SAG31_NODE_623_length_13492_cov_62.118196_10_plen_102_part_00
MIAVRVDKPGNCQVLSVHGDLHLNRGRCRSGAAHSVLLKLGRASVGAEVDLGFRGTALALVLSRHIALRGRRSAIEREAVLSTGETSQPAVSRQVAKAPSE